MNKLEYNKNQIVTKLIKRYIHHLMHVQIKNFI